jgi:hypothetical protein
MTYEFCVFDPACAPDLPTARQSWDVSRYHDDSQPDFQRDAHKWRIKDALLAFNAQLQFMEPKPPTGGLLGKLKPGDAPQPYLLLSGWHADDNQHCTNYQVYDQAVEVSLPWEPPAEVAQSAMREAWRHLTHLSQQGWNVIYDTERDVLLDLERDFDVVMAQYWQNIAADDGAPDEEPEAADALARDRPAADAAATPMASDKPFTGNVSDHHKPWWKIW